MKIWCPFSHIRTDVTNLIASLHLFVASLTLMHMDASCRLLDSYKQEESLSSRPPKLIYMRMLFSHLQVENSTGWIQSARISNWRPTPTECGVEAIWFQRLNRAGCWNSRAAALPAYPGSIHIGSESYVVIIIELMRAPEPFLGTWQSRGCSGNSPLFIAFTGIHCSFTSLLNPINMFVTCFFKLHLNVNLLSALYICACCFFSSDFPN